MRIIFPATIVGLTRDENDMYTASIVAKVQVPSFVAPNERRFRLPLFSKEQARYIRAVVGDADGVRVDVLIGADAECASRKPHDTRCMGNDKEALSTAASLALEREAMDAHTELDRLGVSRGDGHGLVTRFTLANRITILAQRPPLVNGRPSCCEAAINSEALQMSSSARKWMLSPYEEAFWCPFCRARLPEISGAQP